MASKEKVQVDHSALSGAKPPEAKEIPKEGAGGFVASMEKVLEKAAAEVKAPVPAPAPAVQAPKGVMSRIKKGVDLGPPRILLVGTEGIGKSKWAASAPSPIFISTEGGIEHIDCEKFTWPDPTSKGGIRDKANTYAEVVECLKALSTEPHEYQTVVIDSVDWLERMIWDNVCKRSGVSNIEKVEKGYGKGYTFALDEWREVVDLLARCRNRGMAVILISHAKVQKFEDPENPAYDQYVPRLHKYAQSLLSEWCDAVLFASYKRAVRMVEGKSDDRPIGVPVGPNGGERVIRTVDSPAAKAKNRYELPPEIPLSWSHFAAGLEAFMSKNEKKGA